MLDILGHDGRKDLAGCALPPLVDRQFRGLASGGCVESELGKAMAETTAGDFRCAAVWPWLGISP